MANTNTSGDAPTGTGQGNSSTTKPAQPTSTSQTTPPTQTASTIVTPPVDDPDDTDDEVFASDADELEMLNQRVAAAEAAAEAAETAAEAAIEARANFVARQAAVQAKAQYLAQQAALAAQSKSQNKSQGSRSQSQAETDPSSASLRGFGKVNNNSGDYLDVLTRVFEDMNNNDWNPDQFDNASQGLSMVLGSGPAFAALGSMLANTTAQSAVLMNATHMQRQLDLVGLQCTSACVKQLLNLHNKSHDSDEHH